MAAALVAAGVGAAGLITGIVQNKKSQKKNPAQAETEKLTNALFEETDPVRKLSIQQALDAMMTGKANDSITLAEHSAIVGNQSKVKDDAARTLGREGLLNSSYGNQQLTNIDTATSQMLTSADVSETKRLTQFGEQAGFQGLGTEVQGLLGLSQLQQTQALLNQRNLQQQGQASGALLGLLLGQLFKGNTKNTDSLNGQGLEMLFN